MSSSSSTALPIVKELGLESVDVTPANDLLTETEILKEYPRLKRVAEFHALWLSYEMLMERENAKYERVQRCYHKHPFLLKDKPELAKVMDETKIARFKVSDEARVRAKESWMTACKFFDQHYKPLVREKMSKPKEASLEIVKEKMTGSELEEIVRILRSQWKDLVAKLRPTQ